MSAAHGVLDSWAVLALLRGEGQAALAVRRYLNRARTGNLSLSLSLVSLGEIYYRIARLSGEDSAEEAIGLVRELPVEVVPVREPLVLASARIKARHQLSYADAFVVATAHRARSSAGVLGGMRSRLR